MLIDMVWDKCVVPEKWRVLHFDKSCAAIQTTTVCAWYCTAKGLDYLKQKRKLW